MKAVFQQTNVKKVKHALTIFVLVIQNFFGQKMGNIASVGGFGDTRLDSEEDFTDYK